MSAPTVFKWIAVSLAALILVPIVYTALVIEVAVAHDAAAAKAEAPYVVLGTAPFFKRTVNYRPECRKRMIDAVRTFSTGPDTRFMLGGELETTWFNASANTRSLNLNAVHTPDFDGPTVSLSATSRGQPTGVDVKVAEDFASRLEAAC